MNPVRQENTPLIVGLVLALIINLLGVTGLGQSFGVGGGSYLDSKLDGDSAAERKQRERMERALKEMQSHPDAANPEDDLVKPGLEKGSDAGMAWIGYEEFEEHIARHAETDQAAFTDKAPSGGGAPAVGAPTAAPPSPTPELATTPEQPAPAQPAPPQPPAPPPPPPTPAEIPNVPVVAEGLGGTLPIIPAETPKPAPEQPPLQAAAPVEPQLPPSKPTTASSGAAQAAPAPGNPGAGAPSQDTGAPSETESDATSIIDAPPSKWRNGKPLAAKGLEIITKKPELPILTRLTTSPANPICEILFGKDGKPVTCRILVSSGSEDVDGPVLDALYRWRAKGSQLDKLGPGKTARFRVRFILN